MTSRVASVENATGKPLGAQRSALHARLFSLAWREGRSARRRLLLYMSSISIGVAALVAIDSFAGNVSRSVREQSRALLGGDVAFSARDWTPRVDSLFDSLNTHGATIARVTTFASMALVPRTTGTRLVQVRGVTPEYPLYGEVTTTPAGRWAELQRGRNAVVDPALLVALDAQVGDSLGLGYAKFRIIAAIASVPGDPGITAAIGPRVFIPSRYVAATRLLVFGSRAEHDAYAKLLASTTPERFVAPLQSTFRKLRVRVRTVAESESNIQTAIDQLSNFLGIVGLIALLLGGIGVASGVHAFVARKIDTVAVLRCLGATSGEVLVIYLTQAAAMGLAGAAIGVALGVGVQLLLPSLVRDFIPVDVQVRLEPMAIGLGLALGVWVALAFALRPLVALRRISPLQAIRRESDTRVLAGNLSDWPRHLTSLLLVASVVLLTMTRARSTREVVMFSVGIAAAITVLWLSAGLLSVAARRLLRAGWPYVVRQGVANLYRPQNQTRAVVLSLGFGAFLISTLYLVHANLLRQFEVSVQASAANLVFFDVQEDQAPKIDSLVRTAGFQVLDRVPIVTMRVAAVNGRAVADIIAREMRDQGGRGAPADSDSASGQSAGAPPLEARGEADQGRGGERGGARGGGRGQRRARGPAPWALRREYRSTYRDTLTSSEKIVAGKWFGRTPRRAGDPPDEVSLDAGVARELGVSIGDVITWDVQGVRVPARVTSFRDVVWARLQPNFFAVFTPPAVEHAPKMFAMLARVSDATAAARVQRAVVARYPNVSSVDLSLIRKTIEDIVRKVTTAIRFLAVFSLAMGIPLLFSAVAATRRDRVREGVLLKTLGATRHQIGQILFAEYALLGVLGSLTGMLLSFGGAWGVLHYVFDRPFTPATVPALAIAATMIVLTVSIGLLSGRDVFRETPMAALREA